MHTVRGNSLRKGAILLALLAPLWAARPAAADAPGKIVKLTGQEIPGVIGWNGANKQYVVDLGAGNRTFVPLSQVGSVTVAPPAGLAQAINANSVDALGKIVDDYLMLGPDLTAMRALAQINLKSGQGKLALDRFNRVMADRSVVNVPADVARAYWDVLLDSERYSDLREQLKAAIEKGPRAQAAVAQLLRGDMNVKQKAYRDALVDGYLRTIVLFSDIRDVQPEALSKAAKCFEELGESQNAEKMRRKLAQDYPDSPYSK